MRRLIFLLLSFSIAGWTAQSIVSIRAIPPSEALKPGTPAILTVELTIPPPYHINSNRPLEDYLIPTTLEFDPLPGVAFGDIIFPVAPAKKLKVSDTPMSVYEGALRITAKIIPSASLAKEITIRGYVRYQACNDSACLPPVRQPFSVTLPASGAGPSRETGKSLNAKQALPDGGNETPAFSSIYANFAGKGLLPIFLLVFLGGLALNLTPCVYPMIPITISYFGGISQGKKRNLAAHSILYVIGMALMYSILGVAAAMTGSLFGAAQQQPLVLAGIAFVMTVLALSMFDVYELRMPAFLNRVAGSSSQGFTGSLFMGLTVGIVAAPCIGPFVLGLLAYVGNKGDAFLGFALFFVLALGLGVPFLVLGIFSGNISRLPRSGEWMVWIRKIFGFILLAMAAFFLKPLFPNPLVYQLTLALEFLLAGIYLAWIDPTSAPGKVFPFIRNVVGILFFTAALYAAFTGIQSRIDSAIQAGAQTHAGGQSIEGRGAVQWQPYSANALAQAVQESKPLFLDFYADWCAPCKELDDNTFSDAEVVALSRKFVMLKIDLTSAGEAHTEALRQKYKARGVPTLVFLKPDGREIENLRGVGFESKDVFLGKMRQALSLTAK